MCHTITYFVMGLLAFHFLHYADFINKPNSGMRPASDPLVMLGPALQILRGVLFALVFYPFREVLFTRRSGWLLIAWMLIGVGILGTFAAAPGSFEGFIYTTVPVTLQQLDALAELYLHDARPLQPLNGRVARRSPLRIHSWQNYRL